MKSKNAKYHVTNSKSTDYRCKIFFNRTLLIQKLKSMPTFEEYYKELLKREDSEQREMISVWDKTLISEISQDFEQAVESSKFIDSVCNVRPNSSK